MADQKAPDPAAAFRDMVAQWEKGFNKLANDTMGTEAFAQAMHKFTSVPMGMQAQLGDLIGKYLSALNLPSRAEMVNIGERIQAMESALLRIESRLAGSAPPAAQTPPGARPPRTKKPPSAEDEAS